MKKDKQFSIRISEQDLETIRRKAAQAHMSQSDYVTACCLRKQIVILDGLKEVLRLLLRDDVPQADIVGIVRRDHDLHVAQRHLEDIVRLALPEDFTILDAGYHTSTMHRIDDLISYL